MLSGDNVAADLDENDNVTARYFTNGVDNIIYVERKLSGEWKKYYYHTNHLGSVVAITDEDGNVVNKYEYTDPWGSFERTCPSETIGKPCITNRYIYTGREYDADIDMYYYRARWYDQSIQRFISEDPISNNNLYSYVNNNPVNYTDPTGNISVKDILKNAKDKLIKFNDDIERGKELVEIINSPDVSRQDQADAQEELFEKFNDYNAVIAKIISKIIKHPVAKHGAKATENCGNMIEEVHDIYQEHNKQVNESIEQE